MTVTDAFGGLLVAPADDDEIDLVFRGALGDLEKRNARPDEQPGAVARQSFCLAKTNQILFRQLEQPVWFRGSHNVEQKNLRSMFLREICRVAHRLFRRGREIHRDEEMLQPRTSRFFFLSRHVGKYDQLRQMDQSCLCGICDFLGFSCGRIFVQAGV